MLIGYYVFFGSRSAQHLVGDRFVVIDLCRVFLPLGGNKAEIILDPEHSAHPAFAPGDAMLFPEKVCHSFQRVSVPEKSGQITISIQAHSTDDIFVRVPQKGKTASYSQTLQPKEASSMPIIQEEINRAFYTKAIEDAIQKYKKEGGIVDG